MLESLSERSKRISGRGRDRAARGVVLVLLILAALASGAKAQQMACTDCHGVTGPHPAQCRDLNYCTGCHTLLLHHPTSAGTPGLPSDPASCRTCHLAGNQRVHDGAPAIDIAAGCSQCHGLSSSPRPLDLPTLTIAAKDMHKSNYQQTVYATPSFVWTVDAATSYQINFDAATTICPTGYTCSYAWDFGDSTGSTGVTVSKQYANPSPVDVKLTVTVDGFTTGRSITKTVTPVFVNHAPVAAATNGWPAGTTSTNPAIVTNPANVVSFTDNSTDVDSNILSVSVNWGDGIVETQTAAGGMFTHNYTRAANYTIIHTVRDAGGLSNVERAYIRIVPPKYVISGTVSVGGTPASGVALSLKYNGITRASATTTSGTPNYAFPAQPAGSYTMTLTKSGCQFNNPGAVVLTTGDATINITGTCP
jgi:hypothetical protein